MPPRKLILGFAGLPSATRTTIASLTAQELKQRGWNIETLEGEHLTALQSTAPQTPEGNVEAFVEVELGLPEPEEADLNLTKIVLRPDAEPEQNAADLLSKLEGLGLVAGSSPQDSLYDEDDEAMLRSRLEALGYL